MLYRPGRRPLALALLLLLALPTTACRSFDDGGAGPMRWTKSETSPVLTPGTTLRASYYPMISPTTYDWYAFVDGKKIETLDELRKHVVTIDTEEKALAYRDLLRDVRLEQDDDIFPLAHGTSLSFHDAEEHRHWMAEYGPAEVARWGVRKHRKVTQRDGAFEIVEVQHRYIPDRSPPDPDVIRVGTEAIELVMETIHADGRYARTVLRILEQGRAAEPYGPAPLL